MTIKGVFFDLYGTLLMYGDLALAWQNWLAAFHKNLSDFGLIISMEKLSDCCNGFFSKPEPPDYNGNLTMYEKRIDSFCRELEWELNPEQLRIAADNTAFAWQRQVSLDPEAKSILQMLQPTRKLVLVSNYDHPPHIFSLLSRYNLTDYFNQVIVSGDVGFKKPDPEIFRIALNRANLSADDIIHVGDSSDDVDGALKAGIRPVLIKRPGLDQYDHASDYYSDDNDSSEYQQTNVYGNGVKTISSLRELPGILNTDY